MHTKNNHLIIACCFGTLLEWFDYVFYAYITTTLARLFFPGLNHRNAIFATFGIFAAGFLMRPVGAILFGHIGDKLGRKAALTGSLALMGIASLGVGLTPTYATIGIYGSLLLLSFRLLQGISLGGEYNGAAIFLIEHAKKQHSTLTSSLIPCAAVIGTAIGTLVALIVMNINRPEWAWRIPFIIGSLSTLLGIYMRANIKESPSFTNLVENNRITQLPIVEIFKTHKFALLQTCLLAAFIGTDIYICNLYYVTFAANHTHFSQNNLIILTMLGTITAAILIPIMAMMSDHVGRHALISIGLIGTSITAPMIFLLSLTNLFELAALGQIMYGIFNAAVSGAVFKFTFDLFPAHIRYTGCSLAWSAGITIFVGTAPLTIQYLDEHHHFLNAGPLYVTLIALITLICITGFENKVAINNATFTLKQAID